MLVKFKSIARGSAVLMWLGAQSGLVTYPFIIGYIFFLLVLFGIKRQLLNPFTITGIACNMTAIYANGGYMPADIEHVKGFWEPLTNQTHVRFLCDTLLGFFSIGDVFIVTGIVYLWKFKKAEL